MSGVWWSQPYPPEGTMASESIQRQLGTPSLDPLAVLVRETAQNSWDARSVEAGGVTLRYSLYEVQPDMAAAMHDRLLPGPTLPEQPDPLADAVAAGSRVLLISDRGTVGLGGPLRSDVMATPGEAPDFVNFIRNVGEARDRELGGGTYGFGKGILYGISHPSTSHARDDDSPAGTGGEQLTTGSSTRSSTNQQPNSPPSSDCAVSAQERPGPTSTSLTPI